MKRRYLFALLSVSLAGQLGAATTVLVDFNDTTPGTYPGTDTWNAFAAPGDITTDGSLVDSSNTASGVTLSYAGILTPSGFGGTVVYDTTLAPNWVTSGSDLAAADYFYTDTNLNDQASVIMTFSGLTDGAQVSLDLWTSRANSSSGVGFYDYSVDGGTNWLGFSVLENSGVASNTDGWDTNTTLTQAYQARADGNDEGRYMSAQSVTIDGTTLQFRVTDSAGNWASVGAARLTVIPEPSSYAMLAGLLAMCALAMRRR